MESHILLLREADARLGSELRLMEDTVEVPVFFVIPADVFQVDKSPAFDLIGHFLETGKRAAGRWGPRFEPSIDGQAQPAHFGKNFQPRQQEPAGGQRDSEGDTASE